MSEDQVSQAFAEFWDGEKWVPDKPDKLEQEYPDLAIIPAGKATVFYGKDGTPYFARHVENE